MSTVDCFQGSGCLVNIDVAEINACWSSGGVVSHGNWACSNSSTTGFCLGANQTALTQYYQSAGYGTLECKTSAARKLGTRTGLALLAAAFSLLLPTAAAMPTATDCATEAMKSLVGSVNGTTVYACDSAFTLVSAKPMVSNSSGSLGTRCEEPTTYVHKQVQVLRTGTWWDAWAPDSNCYECGQSTGQCSAQLSWSDTITSSFSVGFDTGDQVLKLIKQTASLNFGYTWSKSHTAGSAFTCYIEAGGTAILWVQNKKGWADSKTRTVTTSGGCGSGGTIYSPWSEYHSNWALDDADTIHLGCTSSSGQNCPNSS